GRPRRADRPVRHDRRDVPRAPRRHARPGNGHPARARFLHDRCPSGGTPVNNRMRSIVLMLAAPVTSVVVAVVLSGLVLLVAGSNPFTAFGDMLSNGIKLETIVDMLNKATPLYLSGVAAAIGFRMALF